MEVVTNNPEVQELLGAAGERAGVQFVPGTPLDVIDAAELRLQQGYRLVSAPLPSNIPMMRAPYRSLLLERADRQYDVQGFLALEKARERFSTQRAAGVVPPGTERDFAFLDGEHLLRTLEALRAEASLSEEEQ